MSEELQKAQSALTEIKSVFALKQNPQISASDLIPLIEPILKILERLESQSS